LHRRIVALLIATIMLVAPMLSGDVALGQGRDAERDIAEAGATADELFMLAADRKFNAIYDRIHPDAQAIVPRAAAVGAFTDIYEAAQAGRAEIQDVQIGAWTWGVTEQTYDYAAQVRFVQPFVDENGHESLLEDRMYLVESGGEWRWFFGSNPDFVAEVIAQYGGQGALGQPVTDGDLLANVVNDLDVFYRDVLGYTDYTYYTPGVVVVEEGAPVMSACGPAETGFWGFYCPLDQTIYLDEPLLVALGQEADFAAAFVIAHEWAHHVQTGVEIQRAGPGEVPDDWNEVYSIELELMADCMAGAWTLDVDTRGLLEPGDVDEAVDFTVERLGDPAFVDEYDPQAHGTADQRAQSFLLGYEQGFLGCNITI
jgi:predicted metalloprotease